MTEPPFDVSRAHRWFAIEWNNLSWDLVEAETRTDEQVEQMIHAAHGACLHWQAVGDLLNQLRAQCLLAAVYIAAGNGPTACRYAGHALSLSDAAGDAQLPFDRASALGCAATAFAICGDSSHAANLRDQLTAVFDTLTCPEEQALIEKLYLV